MEQERIEKPLFGVFSYMGALHLCHGKAKKTFFQMQAPVVLATLQILMLLPSRAQKEKSAGKIY